MDIGGTNEKLEETRLAGTNRRRTLAHEERTELV
jgi:hypothetical protein